MKKVSILAGLSSLLLLGLCPASHAARRPDWVVKRPVSGEFYLGIAKCAKKGREADYREAAKNAALLDLATEIEVNISGEFVLKLTERMKMVEDEVRSELKSVTRARMTGHELVSSWEDAKEYWVYYRLSKAEYAARMAAQRQQAIAATMAMRAKAREQMDNPASALRFCLQGLARMQDFVDDAIVSDIWSDLELLLGGIRLTPARKTACAIIGESIGSPLEFRAVRHAASGPPVLAANLPLAFSFVSGEGRLSEKAQTDSTGIAKCHVACVTATNAIQAVKATVDLGSLCGQESTNAFFSRLMSSLTVPSTVMEVRAFPPDDRDSYLLGTEFGGRDAIVLCARELNGEKNAWPKMRDEISGILRGAGATVRDSGVVSPGDIMKWSSMTNAEWTLADKPAAGVMVLIVADGKLNKRKNDKSPLGEDCALVGQIRSTVTVDGVVSFSDNYEAMGGWNPLGEDMCMGVQAIHVARRWKTKYLQQMNAR